MYSARVLKHLLERGVIVIHILKEPLLGWLWLGQGLCERLDSLHEVVGAGLINCDEAGFVSRVHLLFWRSTQCYYCPQRSGRKLHRLHEMKDEWEEEVGWNRELIVEGKCSLHAWTTWETRTTWATRCGVQTENDNNTNKQEYYVHTHLSRVLFHVHFVVLIVTSSLVSDVS